MTHSQVPNNAYGKYKHIQDHSCEKLRKQLAALNKYTEQGIFHYPIYFLCIITSTLGFSMRVFLHNL